MPRVSRLFRRRGPPRGRHRPGDTHRKAHSTRDLVRPLSFAICEYSEICSYRHTRLEWRDARIGFRCEREFYTLGDR